MSKALVVRFFLVTLFISLLASQTSAQSIEISIGRNRNDFFLSTGYGQYLKQHKISGEFGIGITKTFRQQRFNPRIRLEYAYDFLKSDHVFLGPSLHVTTATYVLSKSVKSRIWNDEYLVGGRLEVGDKFKFSGLLSFGLMSERSTGNFYLSYGFNAKVGLIYSW